MRLVHFVLAAIVALLLAGCATKRDVVVSKLRGRGTARVYPVTADQAWAISKTILRLEPTEAIEEHRSEGYMLTNDTSASLAPSTYMGVFVEAEGTSAAKVTFVTKRRTPTQGYATLTEGAFHRKFGELLGLMAAVGAVGDAGATATTNATGTATATMTATTDAGTGTFTGTGVGAGADGGWGGGAR